MKSLRKIVFCSLYATIGSSMLVFLLKQSLPYLDFRWIQQLHLYREDAFFKEAMDQIHKVDKLIEALEENENITEEQLQIMLTFKEGIENHPYLNFADIYQRFRTCKIELSGEGIRAKNGNQMLASYSYTKNIYTIYLNTGGKIVDLKHELGHTILGRLTDYTYLNEGITELYVSEYCNNGNPSMYFSNVNCVRILCELIDPNILLYAQSKNDSVYLIEALTAICKDEALAKLLLDTMENYCKKESLSHLVQEDRENFKNIITLFVSEIHDIDASCVEQIWYYVEQIFIPSFDKRKEMLFYFNSSSLSNGKQFTMSYPINGKNVY